MAKKSTQHPAPQSAGDVVHEGRRSWWNSRVHTTCGLVLSAKAERVPPRWFTNTITCPACLAKRS